MEVNDWTNAVTVVTPNYLHAYQATSDLTKFEVFVEKFRGNLQMIYQGCPFTKEQTASIDLFIQQEFDKYSYRYNEPRLIHHNGKIVDVTRKPHRTTFSMVGEDLHIQIDFVFLEKLALPYEEK